MGGKPGAADGAYRLASLNCRKPTSGRVPSVRGPVALVLREANTGKSGAGGYSIGPDRGKLVETPPVAGAKRQRWTASDTAGNQEIGRLYFLYAVSTPWLTRAKLTGHPLFGALAHVPFAKVLERAAE